MTCDDAMLERAINTVGIVFQFNFALACRLRYSHKPVGEFALQRYTPKMASEKFAKSEDAFGPLQSKNLPPLPATSTAKVVPFTRWTYLKFGSAWLCILYLAISGLYQGFYTGQSNAWFKDDEMCPQVKPLIPEKSYGVWESLGDTYGSDSFAKRAVKLLSGAVQIPYVLVSHRANIGLLHGDSSDVGRGTGLRVMTKCCLSARILAGKRLGLSTSICCPNSHLCECLYCHVITLLFF